MPKLFDEMDINWDEVKGTKDIGVRDYMQDTIDKYRTDSRTIYKDVLKECFGKQYSRIDAGIKLDGGNFMLCGFYRLRADKVFQENGGNEEKLKLFLDILGRYYFLFANK